MGTHGNGSMKPSSLNNSNNNGQVQYHGDGDDDDDHIEDQEMDLLLPVDTARRGGGGALFRIPRQPLFLLCLLLSFFCFALYLGDLWHAPQEQQQEERPVGPAPLQVPRPGICRSLPLPVRRVNVSVADFGAVGDGITLNTLAFQRAIAHIASRGGGQLYIPPGKWVTGTFNLTSHFTLYLHRNATILGSQDFNEWPIIDFLPSYGQGRELPGGRHSPLINGVNLTDVVITGENGTIDGQGSVWWQAFRNKTLDYTRGHLLELSHSKKIIITNLTFQNSPFWTIHPIYCRKVYIRHLTILAPTSSPNTDGIDPDSSSSVCIQDCYIDNGDDVIVIKSGLDEYGIAYGRPSYDIVIRNVVGRTRKSAGFAIGSEMSGGVRDVYVENLVVLHSDNGIRIKTGAGRGGYVKNVYINNVTLHDVKYGLRFQSDYNEHQDDKYNVSALATVENIVISNVRGFNQVQAGRFNGFHDSPFTCITLSNMHFNIPNPTLKPWDCIDVQGWSKNVHPTPCPELQS